MARAGALTAVGVVVRRHPATAAAALLAGLVRAGRVGLREFAGPPRLRPRERLSRQEIARLRRLLEQGADERKLRLWRRRMRRRQAAAGVQPILPVM
jgi:hypothetical protein